MQRTVWLESPARCLSKSYIALPIAVVAAEIAGDVLVHGRLERHEARVIAGPPQALDTRLGEILILSADCFRHVDIFNIHGPTQRLEHGADHITKAFRLAGADVEDAVYPRGLQKPAQY